MYLEKKKIGNNTYNYIKASFRIHDKVRTKTIAYLGKGNITKKELDKKIKEIPYSKIEKIKSEILNLSNQDSVFLTNKEQKKLQDIKNEFKKKKNSLDSDLINDMFKDFKTYYIYNTNAIEGNSLTLQETNLLLNENKTPKARDLREIYDHINEKETFDFILENHPEISGKAIIKLHSMLLKNIDKRTGFYRKHNVRVFGADFNTTPAQYVESDMKILLRWYNKNKNMLHPLILASVFHEKFEKIHPFYDGNGRTGRMLVNLILIKNGYPPVIIENKKRDDYYKSLSKGHKAELTKIEPENHKQIVKFIYNQMLKTFDKIFSKWG